MKIVKIAIDLIGVIGGIITILTLFITPESIKNNIIVALPLVIQNISNITRYAYAIIVIPIASGVVYSRKHNGFSQITPFHLISSVIIYPFWEGFFKGLKAIGLISIVLMSIVLLNNLMKGYI